MSWHFQLFLPMDRTLAEDDRNKLDGVSGWMDQKEKRHKGKKAKGTYVQETRRAPI